MIKTKHGKNPLAGDSLKLVAVILSSIGILLCLLLFSWFTINPGLWSGKYTHFRPLHNINTARLSGRVIVSEVLNPLKGGIITISHRNSIVDKDGFYVLPPIKPGDYDMSLKYNELVLYEGGISLKQGENKHDFMIKAIVPGCMARYIPEGTPDTEMFSSVSPRAYSRGNPKLKRVAITIDDGWFEHNTLLDYLHSYGIRCTVFILGGRGIADARPHWIKKMDDYGFEVCNHTYDHTIITSLSDEKLEENIRKAQKNITKVTHKIYPYFRPPFGVYDKRTLEVLARNGYKAILWTVSIQDTYRGIKQEQQVSHVLKHLKNGAIILVHFGAYNTLRVIKELVPKILEQGYEIVTVSEVLAGLE